MDWNCYNCEETEEGDIVLICDRCEVNACHLDCDHSLRGVMPEGDWYCHFCRWSVAYLWLFSNILTIWQRYQLFMTLSLSLASFRSQSVTFSHLFALLRTKVALSPSSISNFRMAVPLSLQCFDNPSINFGFHPFNILTYIGSFPFILGSIVFFISCSDFTFFKLGISYFSSFFSFLKFWYSFSSWL